MDEGSSNDNTSVESSADVHASTTSLVQKHRGRGRPKGSRNKAGEVQSEGQAQPATPVDPAVMQANLALVKKTTESVVGAIDGLVCRKVTHRAKRLGAPDAFCTEIWQSVQLTKSEVDVVGDCTSTIVARHEVLLRYAPEVMLACVLASYGVRVATVMKRLDGMEAALRAKHHQETKPLTEVQQ